jgi:hypothetical protein
MKRFVLGVLIAGSIVLPGTPVFADASAGASCIGIGSSSEAPQGRDDIALLIKEFHELQGFDTPGEGYSTFAKLHAGSPLACFGEEPPPPPHL